MTPPARNRRSVLSFSVSRRFRVKGLGNKVAREIVSLARSTPAVQDETWLLREKFRRETNSTPLQRYSLLLLLNYDVPSASLFIIIISTRRNANVLPAFSRSLFNTENRASDFRHAILEELKGDGGRRSMADVKNAG